MANPRKFAEKIALHTAKQQEETRAFEEIMKEMSSLPTTREPQVPRQYHGGSLPNFNHTLDLQNALDHLNNLKDITRGNHGFIDRGPRRVTASKPTPFAPKRFSGIDPSPYHVAGYHLSPPQHFDQGWRRTASDSAIHQSVMGPEVKPKEIDINRMPSYEKRAHSPQLRPKSCEVPGIKVFPSGDQPLIPSPTFPVAANTGSLPDLSTIHFQSPLPTPIDPSEDSPLNQLMSPSPPYTTSPLRPQHLRRHTHAGPSPNKPLYNQQGQPDPCMSPIESRLQQFQFYPSQNVGPNSDFSKMVSCNSTGASPTLSPTSTSPMTPMFNSLSPNSPLSPLAAEMYLKQQQQQTAALQQQLENFSMHSGTHIGGGGHGVGQMHFQNILSQGQTSFPPSLGHLYTSQMGNRVPDLIVTGTEEDMHRSDFVRDIGNAMAGGSIDSAEAYSDDTLKLVLDPLDMQMLSGHDTEVADVATEDQFRMDRLGASGAH